MFFTLFEYLNLDYDDRKQISKNDHWATTVST